MKRSLIVLAVSTFLTIAGTAIWSRQPKAQHQQTPTPAAKSQTESTATPMIAAPETEAPLAVVSVPSLATGPDTTRSMPAAIMVPQSNSSAVKNAEGLVSHEVADLGDGRGPIDRRFVYDANGQITREIRLTPNSGQLIETVEYLRTDNGKVFTRITDAAGKITIPAATDPANKAN